MGRRHWKQKFDPDAKFIFLRRLKLGLDPKNPVVQPGDPVPTGDVRLGKHRLKKWWAAEIIGLADFKAPDELKRERLEGERAEVREALAAAAGVLPGLMERAEALKAETEPQEAELVEIETDLASMKALLERAKLLGVGIEDEALAELLGVEVAEEGSQEPQEPSEPPKAPQAQEETTESVVPREGATIEVTGEGFEVSMPDGSLASVETVEEVAHFVRTGELPEKPPVDEVVVSDKGGGWFDVSVPGEDEPRKVQGQAALDALLAELGAVE